MKKIVLLSLIVLVGIILVACDSAPDTSKERSVEGKVVAISNPFDFNGIQVVAVVWSDNHDAVAHNDVVKSSNIWLAYPTSLFPKELEGKNIALSYKITVASAYSVASNSFESNIAPVVQALSVSTRQ